MNACKDDFLERQPQGRFTPEVLANAKGIDALLVGAYALLDGIGTDGLTPWHGAVSNWVFGGIPSDDAYKGTDAGDQPEQTFIETFQWQSDNTHLLGKWRVLYDGVARTNEVLQTLALAKDISDAQKKQVQAEARFLRGHYHFEAKKMWNMIPYIDEKIYDPSNPNSAKVPNDKDVWPNIEADFKFAVENLPESQSQKGRPTKYAAMAYLAKTYMFQAFPNGKANTAKITAAKALLDQIIASGKYSLAPEFTDNFTVENRNNSESLFEVQYSLTSTADGPGNHGDGLAYPYTDPWGCCGFYQPSQNLVNSYKTQNGLPLLEGFNATDVKNDQGVGLNDPYTPYSGELDPRLDHTVGRRGILYLDFKIHNRDFIRDQNYAGPYSPKKHVATSANTGVSGWRNLNANNFRLIRYSHVLLWAAECEVELGNLEKAREYVNLVRRRAANPEGFVKKAVQGANRNQYTLLDEPAANYNVKEYGSFANQDMGRQAVRFEHRLEFAMEGHRFFDLVRWGIAAETINGYLNKEKEKRSYLIGAQFIKGKHEYYPLPLAEINNSALDGQPTLKQNPGYN